LLGFKFPQTNAKLCMKRIPSTIPTTAIDFIVTVHYDGQVCGTTLREPIRAYAHNLQFRPSWRNNNKVKRDSDTWMHQIHQFLNLILNFKPILRFTAVFNIEGLNQRHNNFEIVGKPPIRFGLILIGNSKWLASFNHWKNKKTPWLGRADPNWIAEFTWNQQLNRGHAQFTLVPTQNTNHDWEQKSHTRLAGNATTGWWNYHWEENEALKCSRFNSCQYWIRFKCD
jgi:hypothetical protein